MPDNTLSYVENDNLPELECDASGIDLTDYEAPELHIAYKPHALVISADVTDALEGEFKFPFASRVSTALTADVEAGTDELTIEAADYASLPSSGELLLGTEETREQVLYTSKTAPDVLVLAAPLSYDHELGEPVEKLPDLRPGRHDAEVSLTDDAGLVLTFAGLKLDVRPEVA